LIEIECRNALPLIIILTSDDNDEGIIVSNSKPNLPLPIPFWKLFIANPVI
jgi:hypothetical protein